MQKVRPRSPAALLRYFFFPEEDLAAGFALAFGFEAVFLAPDELFLAGEEVFFDGLFLVVGLFFAEADVFLGPLAPEFFDAVFVDAVRRLDPPEVFFALTASTAETVAPAAAPEAAPVKTSPTTSLALS